MKKKKIRLINKLRKSSIAFIAILIGILTILFGFRNPETCIVTAIIGGIIFFVGLWILFTQPTN